MKRIFKNLVVWLLKQRAQKVFSSGAKIIGITGSLGKTTAKAAVAHLLRPDYDILVSEEGFNTDIGILLTIFQEKESGFSSPFRWLGILWRAFTKKLPHPQIIILEYGIDRPGDMEKLLGIIQPDISVVLSIAPVHLGPGHFANLEEIAEAKMTLARHTKSQGLNILNIDNPYIAERIKNIPVQTKAYGKDDADFRISDCHSNSSGITFTVSTADKQQNFTLPFFGTYNAFTVLPAIIIAQELGISLATSSERLRTFLPPAGRGRILSGAQGSTIWDLSYNSSPEATKAALQTFCDIPAKRHVALLGNMNELGEYSEKFHEELGATAAKCADEIFFVGQKFPAFSRGVNTTKPLRRFENAQAAGEFLKTVLQEGDALLVKGSQNGVFLERAIKKILRDPADQKLLCRQGGAWEEK